MNTDEFPRVVSLASGNHRRDTDPPPHLPRQVVVVRDTASSWLFARMKEVFAEVDDSLFETAEKVHRQDEQDGIFQALRTLRLERHRVIDQFVSLIGKGFAEVPAPSQNEEFGDEEQASAPGLSLVQDEDLEQQVALKSIVAAAKRDLASPIAELTLRLDTLLPVKIYDDNMPLAPVAICRALHQALQRLDIHLRARLIVLKKFEKLLATKLDALYRNCNRVLIENGVLPDLKDPLLMRRARPRSPRPPLASPASPRGAAGESQPVHSEPSPAMPGAGGHGVMGTAAPGGGATAGHGAYSGAPLGQGHHGNSQPGFGQQAGSPAGQGGEPGSSGYGLVPAAPGVVPMATSDLLQHLGDLQGTVPLQADSVGQVLDVNTLLQQRLVQAQRKASLEDLDVEVIRMVDMLFSFMLEDRNLAEPIKVQLVRLQLPLLKLAVADKAFFSKGGHPARRLFNALADAAIGWQAGKNYQQDRFYLEICRVVERVLREFDSDDNVFDELLQSFDTFVSRERARARVMEKRTLDEVQGKARVEAAKARVAAVFEALTAERQLPRVVHVWLNRVWNNVLFRACLKDGTNSESWRRSVLTARDLVWSAVAPMPESSFKMQQLMPGLRKRLEQGAVSLSINKTELARLLGGLDTLHAERQKLADRVESEREHRTRERLVQELLREADSVMKIPEPTAADGSEAAPAEVAGVTAGQNSAGTAPGSEEPAVPGSDPSAMGSAEAEAALVDCETDLPAPEELERLSQAAVSTRRETLPALANTDEYWRQTYRLKDSWFKLQAVGGIASRCRLAAIIRDLDQFMFVNRSGVRVAVYSRLELAHALRKGTLEPLEQGPLFERALHYVVGNIGETKLEVAIDKAAVEAGA